MPRRNLNADYHRQEKLYPIFVSSSESPSENQEFRKQRRAIIKTTAEQIVREHRTLSAQRLALSERPKAGGFKVPWYKAIHWGVVFEYACWAGAAVAIGYLIIKVFMPFLILLQVLKFGR